MSFVEKALGEHERLIYQARFPFLLRLSSWTALVALVAIPLVAYGSARIGGLTGPLEGWLALFSAAVGLSYFTVTQIYMITTETAITDQRFIVKRGLVARHTTDLPLLSLENIDLHQSVIARLGGFGHLMIAGSGESDIRTPPMQDPVSFRTALSEARIALNQAPAFRAKARRVDPASDAPLGPSQRALQLRTGAAAQRNLKQRRRPKRRPPRRREKR